VALADAGLVEEGRDLGGEPGMSTTESSCTSPGGIGRNARAARLGGFPGRSSTTLSAEVPISRPTASILGLRKREKRSRDEAIVTPP
jgi:hypothetical protein